MEVKEIKNTVQILNDCINNQLLTQDNEEFKITKKGQDKLKNCMYNYVKTMEKTGHIPKFEDKTKVNMLTEETTKLWLKEHNNNYSASLIKAIQWDLAGWKNHIDLIKAQKKGLH